MANLIYKICNNTGVDLGTVIFDHVMSLTPPKESKVHLPYLCLLLGILKSQGFKPYPNEPIKTASAKFSTDARLYSGIHYNDRASLLTAPVSGLVPSPQDTHADSSAAPSTSDPVSASVLVQLKRQAAFYQSTLDNLKSTVSSLQDVFAATEPKLIATHRQINALEEQLASQDPDVEGPSQDDEDTPSGSPVH